MDEMMKKDAKKDLLKMLKKMMMDEAYGDLGEGLTDKAKKVTVMGETEEDLEKGLSVADRILQARMDQDDDMFEEDDMLEEAMEKEEDDSEVDEEMEEYEEDRDIDEEYDLKKDLPEMPELDEEEEELLKIRNYEDGGMAKDSDFSKEEIEKAKKKRK